MKVTLFLLGPDGICTHAISKQTKTFQQNTDIVNKPVIYFINTI